MNFWLNRQKFSLKKKKNKKNKKNKKKSMQVFLFCFSKFEGESKSGDYWASNWNS